MTPVHWTDYLGYLASVLVAISFVMKSIRKLRFVNLVGGVCFVLYGIMIHAWPVVLINLFTIGVNIYYLTHRDINQI